MKLRRNQNVSTWRIFFPSVEISDFPRGYAMGCWLEALLLLVLLVSLGAVGILG